MDAWSQDYNQIEHYQSDFDFGLDSDESKFTAAPIYRGSLTLSGARRDLWLIAGLRNHSNNLSVGDNLSAGNNLSQTDFVQSESLILI